MNHSVRGSAVKQLRNLKMIAVHSSQHRATFGMLYFASIELETRALQQRIGVHPFSHQGATIFITFTVGFYVTLMNSPGVMCLTKGPISNSSLSCFHLEIKFKLMTSRFKGEN